MKKELAHFHHERHNIGMKVVEKDKVISGMLRDELNRCVEILVGLQKSAAGLPKGVLNERKKRHKEKAYSYFSLKYREGGRVVNQHISKDRVPDLKKKLEQREKLEKEMRSYQKRIAYLSKLLKAGRG